MPSAIQYLRQSLHLSEAGLLEEALTPLHIGLGLFPESPELWYEKYRLLKKLGKQEAYAALIECRRVAPSYLPALQAYYEELLKQHRIREAYHVLEEILSQDDQNPRWWAHKAFWAMHFGDFEAAEMAIQKASEAPYQTPEVMYYRALFLARLGNTTEAAQLLEKCLQLDPKLISEAAEDPALRALLPVLAQ
ncbi:MAG: tetratricopeptide repeat protein [Bacteroidia bacterium]|nr:tetratricopeptide repeat protein [Bacteroidia bacterium]MDW8134433.1 tetratricopeptide repeat protein [Bacteroidia bacterium]